MAHICSMFCFPCRCLTRLLSCAPQDKLVQTVVANYVLWPAAHFINFRFVPSQHRILYNNVVAVRVLPSTYRDHIQLLVG